MKRICSMIIALVGVTAATETWAQQVRFDNPRIEGAIVDWCSTWAQNCGAGGANLYCQRRGYSQAVNWGTFNPGRTWVIGSDRLCEGDFCVGFSHVTCTH